MFSTGGSLKPNGQGKENHIVTISTWSIYISIMAPPLKPSDDLCTKQKKNG